MQPSLKHVGICAATRWELQALRRALHHSGGRIEEIKQRPGSRWICCAHGSCRVTLIQTGVGPLQAEQAAKRFLAEESCELMISAGFACALTPAGIGDVLIGTEVVWMGGRTSGQKPMLCDSAYQATALRVAKDIGLTARWGRILTAERVLGRAEEKHRASATTGAIGLDMESAAIGMAARDSGRAPSVPFLVVRVVSDLVDEDLPTDFNLFYGPWGWVRGILDLMRPAAIAGLWRLGSQARLASRHLTDFFEGFLHVEC
jgi:adenosylhomocysteine nucleosidase